MNNWIYFSMRMSSHIKINLTLTFSLNFRIFPLYRLIYFHTMLNIIFKIANSIRNIIIFNKKHLVYPNLHTFG